MVPLLLALGASLLGFSPLGTSSPENRPCAASLPKGPAVPAPIVLETSCGGFRLESDGDVTRLPAGSPARRSGTGRRYGVDLRIVRTRPGRIVLRRAGRNEWRSSGLYPRDGGSHAFGPGSFAFASHRRGVFLTDLRSPERLVLPGVGLYPLAFLRGGSLLVVDGGWGPSISVLSPTGVLLRRYRYRPRHGYAFDERTESLFFVTPGRLLVRARGTGVRVVRPLRRVDGWLSLSGPHLSLQDEDTFTVLRRDGTPVSRWTWPRSRRSGIDYGFVASEDARTFAFRTFTRERGTRGRVVVYLLRPGERRATPVYRHRGTQLGCGTGASLHWDGRFLLYSTTGRRLVIVDSRDGSIRDLGKLAALVPGRGLRAHWLGGAR
jgi:hypothetical protein